MLTESLGCAQHWRNTGWVYSDKAELPASTAGTHFPMFTFASLNHSLNVGKV